MANDKQNVVVLGASPKADRYSNQAVRLLVEHGHHVIPVHPAVETIEGLAVTRKLTDITDNIDKLTVYVSETVSSSLQNDILQLNPDRVIFNPGAENTSLRITLNQHGIRTEEACTLVLLKTGQF
ncbi:MAG: CoA-binding protein [Thermodesulfobacteriota bacterium]|nr:CoA-binding protein [Thermodesulfobacteriota bacterium]